MVDKRPIGYVPGKGTVLDKKPPRSGKYESVERKVQTGLTVRDITIFSDKQVAKRKGELFKRIKASTLANLLRQERNFESVYQLGRPEDQRQNYQQGQPNVSLQEYPQLQAGSYVSDSESIISSVTAQSEASKFTAVTYETQQLGLSDETLFLLLDLREPEEYELYHIREAVCFPAPNVSRDKFIPQIYRFKNKEERMIIIYHFDERQSVGTAQLLAQKGFENVYLISGGIEQFMQDFPEFIEGKKVPVLPKKESNSPIKKSGIQMRSNYRENPEKMGQAIVFTNDSRGDTQARKILETHSQAPSEKRSVSANHSAIAESRVGGAENLSQVSRLSKVSQSKVSKPQKKWQ